MIVGWWDLTVLLVGLFSGVVLMQLWFACSFEADMLPAEDQPVVEAEVQLAEL